MCRDSVVPVEKFLCIYLWFVISHSLHEITLSGRLVYKLSQARCQRLQQHTDVRAAVGLQLLCCYGVQCGLICDAGRWATRVGV